MIYLGKQFNTGVPRIFPKLYVRYTRCVCVEYSSKPTVIFTLDSIGFVELSVFEFATKHSSQRAFFARGNTQPHVTWGSSALWFGSFVHGVTIRWLLVAYGHYLWHLVACAYCMYFTRPPNRGCLIMALGFQLRTTANKQTPPPDLHAHTEKKSSQPH